MKNRVVWKDGENIFVVRKGKTTNDKISDGKPLVQTYTFSEKQWVLASTSKGFGMKKFFALDGSNCLDCPFSVGNGNGGCYTHKFQQYVGFLSMLRSISYQDLTPLNRSKQDEILKMSYKTYVRFGRMVNLRCCLKHWLNPLHGLLTAGRGIHTNGRKNGPMILVSGSWRQHMTRRSKARHVLLGTVHSLRLP